MATAEKKKVLVADDEPDIRDIIVAMIDGRQDYCIITAQDGEEALAVAKRERPDIVLLDLLMSKKTGYEVCEAIKQDPSVAGTKVIVVSALAQDGERHRAAQAGADYFLAKPFNASALLEVLDKASAAL